MTLSEKDIRFASLFGLGSSLPASGTWGSLPPVVVAAWMIGFGLGPVDAPLVYHGVMLAMLVIFSACCIAQGDAAEALHGKDPAAVVADEAAGMCIPLMFLPAAAMTSPNLSVFTLLYAFIAFRVFDIIKLFPAGRLQRVPGAWGILLDDLAAGIQALIVVQILTRTLL